MWFHSCAAGAQGAPMLNCASPVMAAVNDNLDLIRSAVPGVLWPALPSSAGTLALALQFQLDQTQWWPAGDLEHQQMRQLQLVLRHAGATVPFYRERFAKAGFDPDQVLTRESFRALPVLTRSEVQEAGVSLRAAGVPNGHGRIFSGETSGSTGRPVVFYSSQLEQLYWNAFTLRDHGWHQRDLGGRLAAIRYARKSELLPGWGPATDVVYVTGACAILRIDTDISQQVDWLVEQDPEYLLSYASNLGELARVCLERGIRLSRLREVRSVSEVVRPELRALVREAWGVKLTDMYTTKEIGYIALQCPERDHYHVQMENTLVEIIDDRGEPCAPGDVGRVVVTALHKFAMPLIRYEIGDYAVPGERCSCGRGLSVIREILGRTRNMLRLPSGERRWPLCDLVKEPDLPGILQYQYVQKTLERIEVHLVVGPQYSRDMEARLTAIVHRRLGYPFSLDIIYRDNIPRSANGKFEDFRCEISE